MAQVAFLFPGQGAFYAGATRALSGAYPVVQRAMQAIDAVSVRRLRRPLLATVWDGHIGAEDLLQHAPDLLQLAIYATSVSYFEALRARGSRRRRGRRAAANESAHRGRAMRRFVRDGTPIRSAAREYRFSVG
ncbi:acyl transferase domain-containing protein [Burkholderia pseudomallei]|nr:acyl transferase domain-containing protein [Burkholderia pseudomallei]